jgi:dipeptidyl-peptidase 4
MQNTKLVLVSAWLIVASVFSMAQAGELLTLEKIFGGYLQAPSPSELRWSPDGRRLAFFSSAGDGDKSLWFLDAVTGEKMKIISSKQIEEMTSSATQTTASERERMRRIRYDIASFLWSPDSKKILFVSSGRLYLFDIAEHKSQLLVPAKTNVQDPKFSPDGACISFIYEHDIWLAPISSGKEKRLTSGGSEFLLHGDLDWVYQEEFDLRTGYHWSPDSRHIAFLELDEKMVPVYPIVDQLSPQATVDWQRYPKAGDLNPKARVGIINVKSGKAVWLDHRMEYIPRINWADNRGVAIQLLNRSQNELEIIEVNPENGGSHTIFKERDRYWLDITDDLIFMSGGREFLWTSSRSGFRHIYIYSRSGELLKQLTSGEWVVREITGIDENNGWIYFTSNKAETLGRQLFRIKPDGSGVERVTKEPGVHEIQMNALATAFVDSFSSLTQVPLINIQDVASGQKTELFHERSLEKFGLVVPEMKTLKTSDGATIRILIYRPDHIQPGKKLPALVYVYGMPDAPTITDAWHGVRGLFHQFLVQQGYLVVQIDDRSSAEPGHINAVAAYHNFGSTAARDHETAVQYLKSLSYVDADNMAIWGWSGGGYTAAYHLTHTNLFKIGVAGAPVTDWLLYDSIYTERYMGSPTQDREAYDRASAVSAASDCNGRLLIIHGTLDDNVHPQNTYQLIHALIESQKQFDLMIYPGKTHGITGATENIQLYTMIYKFLERYLKGE